MDFKRRYSKPLLATAYGAIVSLAMPVFMGTAQASETKLERQRDTYDKAQDLIDKKDISGYNKIRAQIADYPLTPYVDYRVFSLQLKDKSVSEVNQFIETHQAFPFSSRIRAPFIDQLARQKRWNDLLEFQTTYPNGERYQCHYHYAQLKTGDSKAAYEGAANLWKSGDSVDSACDPLFDSWNKAGLRTDDLILERMTLAFKSRNGSLINYLNKQLKTSKGKQQGKQVQALFKSPKNVATFAAGNFPEPNRSLLTESALQKLARSDKEQARSTLSKLNKNSKLTPELKQSMNDYVAMRFITTDSDSEAKWRDGVLATSSNDGYLERRARLAVQQADWKGLTQWIDKLTDETKQTSRWQYWLARAEISNGDKAQGEKRLESIVGQRNFYSAAAATHLKHSIVYPISTTTFDSKVVAPYQSSLIRIEELIKRDKITAAKSEWRYLLSNVSKPEKEMLAAYAGQKRWHHLTVVATISAKMWDNMSLRFPTAHQWWFNFYGEKLDLDTDLLMSLARQESAMDVEARSPVGARGVMQIMPATAKYTAKKHKIAYKRTSELYQVNKNIEIGSHYLNELLGNYDNNRIFALAAYNAGPNRVKRWRAASDGNLDAIAFIEAIPFRETRGYVQNILMFQVYYRDLMGVQGSFLTDAEANKRY
ncbi:murein transglycosylase [Vibrio sp. SCSIO 43140]|uniref:murein transglycosylase n=1 Tax=Vibrio sp. SCSIO 43140 TaxID=2819100 RepID=UPI0020753FC1|nr:murein transglycosylase [Vibrio sp. SCSIO 43140]USD60961.1 murein transglycosylase [Vibrio sp. SCSIO 43140]